MPKIKIAILANSLVPPHPAGTQIMEVIDLLNEEFDFTIFAKEIDKSLEGKVKFVKVPIPLIKPLLLRYTVQFILFSRLFKRRKLHQEFDIVHAIEPVSPYATLATLQYCAGAAKELIKKGILQYKGWRKLYYKILLFWGTRTENILINNKYLEGVIVPSKGLMRDLLHYHKTVPGITIIPNGVDLKKYRHAKVYRTEMRKKLGIAETDFVGVIAGLGDWERKGLGCLIDAAFYLKQIDCKILVIGDGNIDLYKNLVAKKNVRDSFVFVGVTKELEKYYGLSDFFILPTANEAWSVVTLIAAASGLPLLATKVNGVEDFIIEGKNGFFIERNPKSIVDKIKKLKAIGKDLEIMGENSAQFAGDFDIFKVARQYAAYYQNLYTTVKLKETPASNNLADLLPV